MNVTVPEADRRQLAVRELRRIRKITKGLAALYPELAATFDLQQGLYERSVAAAIMISERSGKRARF